MRPVIFTLLCMLGSAVSLDLSIPMSIAFADAKEPLKGQTLTDIDGKRHQVDSPMDRKGMVVIFISEVCPIANSYQPELERLRADYERQGYKFIMVHSDPELTVEKARVHLKEFGIGSSIVLDPQHDMARLLEAKATPEAFLIDRSGAVVYRGRIDDRYIAIGKKKVVASRFDLRVALEEHSQGLPIATPVTTAVGCLIRVRKPL